MGDIFWTLSWPFSCDYNFWRRDLKFCMWIKDLINKTCWKNGKDLLNRAPKIKLWNHTNKHFPVFAKNFRRLWMKLKIFFCQFPNPWTLRVSGMGGYTSKCEKKSKSLHPITQPFTTWPRPLESTHSPYAESTQNETLVYLHVITSTSE